MVSGLVCSVGYRVAMLAWAVQRVRFCHRPSALFVSVSTRQLALHHHASQHQRCTVLVRCLSTSSSSDAPRTKGPLQQDSFTLATGVKSSDPSAVRMDRLSYQHAIELNATQGRADRILEIVTETVRGISVDHVLRKSHRQRSFKADHLSAGSPPTVRSTNAQAMEALTRVYNIALNGLGVAGAVTEARYAHVC